MRLLTRRPITEWFAEGREALAGFRAVKIGLDPPRGALYERLNARCQAMFEAGLVEELKGFSTWDGRSRSSRSNRTGIVEALRVLRGR